jgi:hypothetical protein
VALGRVVPLLANWHVYVDAATGDVLGRVNRVEADRVALTYASSPLEAAPEPAFLESLELADQACIAEGSLPAEGPDGEEVPDASTPRLCTSRVAVRNCLDYHDRIVATIPGQGEVELHVCTEYHQALPNDAPGELESPDDELANDFYYDDAGGDLSYDFASDPAGGEDLFAEVNAFHHLERAVAYFEGLDPSALDGLGGAQVVASVNWRTPIDPAVLASAGAADALAGAAEPFGALFPFEGAFYMPASALAAELGEPAASLVFFQGRRGDYAYDADVISHELGHAVIDAMVGGEVGLGAYHRDELGLHRMAAAMSEAYADFFASARSGDPVHAAYAASLAGGEPRDLSAPSMATCPRSLVNDPHLDSLVYSQALWELRDALGGDDPAAIERAVLLGAAGLLPDAGFDEGAAATVASVEALLGADAAAQAEAVFALHGYGGAAPCSRVIHLDRGEALDRLDLEGTQDLDGLALTPFVPAVVQLEFDLTGLAYSIVVSYRTEALERPGRLLPGSERAQVALLVRQGDAPVAFAVTGATGAEADGFVASDEPDPAGSGARRLVYSRRDGERLAEGAYHLALVDMGSGGASLRSISIDTLSSAPTAPPAETDPGYGDLEPWDFPSSAACACAAASPHAGAAAAALLRLLP